jgi:hypothetical protein
MTTITVNVPAPRIVAVPRMAHGAGSLFARLLTLATPAPRAPRSPAEEAAEVRELAYRVQRSDPGFAADLMAAAARHEGLEP